MSSSPIEAPPPKMGWLSKRARSSLLANWKKRYVVLSEGCLVYYEKLDKNGKPFEEKGRMILKGAEIVDDTASEKASSKIYISADVGEKDIMIDCNVRRFFYNVCSKIYLKEKIIITKTCLLLHRVLQKRLYGRKLFVTIATSPLST
jgi:hypothetical protein